MSRSTYRTGKAVGNTLTLDDGAKVKFRQIMSFSCPYCRDGRVRVGYVDQQPVGIHREPVCERFAEGDLLELLRDASDGWIASAMGGLS